MAPAAKTSNRSLTTQSTKELARRDSFTNYKPPVSGYDPISLSLVSQQTLSYTDSLMRFVEDLGPTVQNFAKKKLEGILGSSSSCQIPVIQAPPSQGCTTFEAPSWRFTDSIISMENTQSDLKGAKDGFDILSHSRARAGVEGQEALLAHCLPEESEVNKRRKVNETRKKVEKNRATAAKTRRSEEEETVRPVILALEAPRPKGHEIISRRKVLTTSPRLSRSCSILESTPFATATTVKSPETETGTVIGSDKCMPMLSGGYPFDLQFFKSRLDLQQEQASTSTDPLLNSHNQQQCPSTSTSSELNLDLHL